MAEQDDKGEVVEVRAMLEHGRLIVTGRTDEEKVISIADELKHAYENGESASPRLLYTRNELTEMRKLQAIAQAEHAEIHRS